MSRTYRSKHEADEFAEFVKKKAKSPEEVQLKGYHIASLYCEVQEYKSALPYAESYVAVKPADPRGWKLLGYIFESLKNPAKAIESYRRSLELNSYQKELVLKVAELYCDVNYEAEKHRYWAERAEKYFPNHRIIHKIREHILRSSKNLREYEKYLRDKLRANSRDLYLNMKLVDILLETKQMREGYQHCATVCDSGLFASDPRWWQKAAVFYKSMIGQQSGQSDSVMVQVYSRLLLSINCLVGLGLAKSSAPPSHNMAQIQALDKMLLQASDFLPTVGNALQRPQGEAVMQEVKGQLFFHLATLYLKMAVVGSVSLSDVIELAAACYLTSLQVAPFHSASELLAKKERMDSLTIRLRRLGAERMSEVCHVLKALAQQHDESWLDACREKCCNTPGRQRLFEQIYGIQNPDPRQSFLMMDDTYIKPSVTQLPDMMTTVFAYDQASIQGGNTDLQRLVWLGLQWDIRRDGALPDLGSFIEVTFDRLMVSARQLDNTSVDNLCLMDLEAFLYASIFVARAQLHNLHRQGLLGLNIPVALLVNCYSEEQLDWYMSVYELYSGKARSADLGRLRLAAKKGLEVMRCQKNHGLETQLLVNLGKTFNARAEELRSTASDPNDRSTRREAYQRVSVMYWQAALDHLRLLASNRNVLQPKKPMFAHVHKPLEDAQVMEYLDEGAMIIAEALFEKGEHQMALSHLAKAKTAKALLTKAVMHHTLASMETEGKSLDQVTPDILKKQGDLLDQAKHALFLTMDAIEDEPKNPLHEEVQTLLTEIEQEQESILEQLTSLEDRGPSDLSNLASARRSFLGDSPPFPRTPPRDRPVSGNLSMRGAQSPSTHSEQLSPEPSPRRLAAEMRALNMSQSFLLEQNQRLMQREEKLLESNQELMKQVLQLTKDLQEVKIQQAKASVQAATTPVTPPRAQGASSSTQPTTPSAPPVTLAVPPMTPAAPPTTPAAPPMAPAAQTTPVALHQHPQHQQQLLARQSASPSVQQAAGRGLYQPHPAYHPLASGAYYDPHMVPISPMPGGQAWYPSPSAYRVPSPVPNPAYYAAQQYDRGMYAPGMGASTPRSTGRAPLDSLYGMYTSIGSPEDQGVDQMAGMQGLKQPASAYSQRQLLVSGSAGAATMQGAPSPQALGAGSPAGVGSNFQAGGRNVGQEYASLRPGGEGEARGMPSGIPSDGKSTLMFKGSITSGTPPKSQGSSPAMFSPSPAAQPKGLSASERGAENLTPSSKTPSGSSENIAQPQQGLFRPNVAQGQSQGLNMAKPPSSQLQFSSFSAGSSTSTATKPSQTFNIFSPSTIKPAPSLAKPVTTSAATSPFAGFSFGVTSTTASASSTIPTASVFKPAGSVKASPASTSNQGAFPAVVPAKPGLVQDPRSLSPYPGFYSSPKTHPESPLAEQSSQSQRKPGQSPLARDSAQPKTTDSPKTVTFKPDIDDDDVIFVSMTGPTKEQRARAEKLLLPPGFYLYENAPPCKGCIGCLEDIDIQSLYKRNQRGAEAAPVVRPKDSKPAVFGASGGTLSFGNVAAAAKPSSSGGIFGGGDSAGGISFASLAANQSSGFGSAFGKEASSKPFTFANAGAPVFGGAAKSTDKDDLGVAEEEYDPHYEPIITLPDIGTISTGEEDEDEMFRHRAKLFRYDRSAKAWKERGVGDIKIVKNPKTNNARILMRRDQIFKLCANHRITADMELKPMMASETAWVWTANDFAEEEPKLEQLAVKFKHADTARQFKEMFTKAQEMIADKEPEASNQDAANEPTGEEETDKASVVSSNPQLMSLLMADSSQKPKEEEEKKSFAERFAKKPGTWDCDACYINNKADTLACVACTTPKPGTEPTKSGATAAPSGGGVFKVPAGFGLGTAPPSQGFTFGQGGSAAPSSGFSFGTKTESAKGGASGGASNVEFKLPAEFSLSKSKDSSQPSSGSSKAGASSDNSFKLPSGSGLFSQSSAASSGTTESKEGGAAASVPSGGPFVFGGGKPPGASDGAAAASGSTTTDKFSFGSGMQQFSFGNAGAETKPGAGFSFASPDVKSQPKSDAKSGFQFSDVLKAMGSESPGTSKPASTSASSQPPLKPALTFADLAKSQGASFSFRMDIKEVTAKSPVKSPGGGRSPKTSLSRGPRSPGIAGEEQFEEVEQGDDIYFEPIFQMPDDYVAKTGEEGEEEKFKHRAKLFRYDLESKQWKERGVGDIKLLYSASDRSYRILMRRDQVFKVCANHHVTPSLELRPMSGSDRAWVWTAMDASEGEVVNEQLAVRFKTSDAARDFKLAIEKAKEDLEKSEKSGKANTATKGDEPSTSEVRSCDPKLTGALTELIKASSSTSDAAASPSSSAEAGASKPGLVPSAGVGEVNPEEERDIHFNPIVQLPEKVDLVTGEEGEVAVFSARGKLYRFHSASRSWKERGVGEIKVMHAPEPDAYRVVMRRDQVYKVCANHYITTAMTLHPMSGSDRAWVWHAMDAADGEAVSEQLAIRFKESTTATSFKEAFERAQEALRQKAGDAGQETVTTSKAEGASASKAGDGTVATGSSQEHAQPDDEDYEEGEEEEDEAEDVEDDDDDEYYEDEEDCDDEEDDEYAYEDDEEDNDDDDDDNDDADNDEKEKPGPSMLHLFRDKFVDWGSKGDSGSSTPTSGTSSSSNTTSSS
ncbi:E3 SUMO-protein ligase RanBP2-like [Diadema antillarum]|uniref:E3 SUMO-protein ligase RanBP2-like n=1 Tax=Diadema antillarum TaxID=105358 RepID=UPI003A84BA07